MFGSGWRLGAGFANPVCPGWGLGWVFLGSICGVVPLVSAICGVRGWASVSVCFWDVCGFVGAPLAPRRFRFRRAVWACVPGPGLACAQSVLAGLSGCVFFFFFCFGFFFSFFFFFSGLCGPCPSIPFLAGWAGGSLFFFFFCPFSPWSAVTGLVLPVLGGWFTCASAGVPPPFFFSWGGGLAACGGVGGWFGGCGLFSCLFPFPPPFFFLGGGGACLFLPLPSLGWRTHWPVFSVVFRAAVFSCVLCGHVPAPWVGWALYTVGSAPLLAGLGPGSASWAAAPGGCLWFWVRGLGLLVSLPLQGAGCNLLGGPSPLSPGALWSRVWPVVPVCGVLARRLPGCAVAGFGLSLRLGSVVSCCAALCRVASRRAVVRCSVARCGAVCRGLAWCRGGSVEVSLACVGRLGLREILLNDHGVLGACTLTLTHGLNLHRASQTGRCTRGVRKAFLLQGRQTDIRSRTVEVASERCLSGEWLSLQLGCAGRVRVGAAGRDELTL